MNPLLIHLLNIVDVQGRAGFWTGGKANAFAHQLRVAGGKGHVGFEALL
jgi:hypothetical protein